MWQSRGDTGVRNAGRPFAEEAWTTQQTPDERSRRTLLDGGVAALCVAALTGDVRPSSERLGERGHEFGSWRRV